MFEKTCRYQCAMLIIRIMVGSTFIIHGGQKLLAMTTEVGLSSLILLVQNSGLPSFLAYLVPFCEFGGGVMILLGFITELGALLIVPVMLGATFFIHWKSGYFLPQGFEYPFNLFLACLALIAGGPGHFALWDPFSKKD